MKLSIRSIKKLKKIKLRFMKKCEFMSNATKKCLKKVFIFNHSITIEFLALMRVS